MTEEHFREIIEIAFDAGFNHAHEKEWGWNASLSECNSFIDRWMEDNDVSR